MKVDRKVLWEMVDENDDSLAGRVKRLHNNPEISTLDRVHVAMILQVEGESQILKWFTDAEVKRGPQFLRLANSLSALYPPKSEEKRVLDAMLLAVPR